MIQIIWDNVTLKVGYFTGIGNIAITINGMTQVLNLTDNQLESFANQMLQFVKIKKEAIKNADVVYTDELEDYDYGVELDNEAQYAVDKYHELAAIYGYDAVNCLVEEYPENGINDERLDYLYRHGIVDISGHPIDDDMETERDGYIKMWMADDKEKRQNKRKQRR